MGATVGAREGSWVERAVRATLRRRAKGGERYRRLCAAFAHLWRARQRERKAWACERATLLARAQGAEERVSSLKAVIGGHARARFGRRSEQRSGAQGQGRGQRGQRRGQEGHGRRRDRFAGLPELHVLHDVPEAERSCPTCGHRRRLLGEETSEELDVELVVRRVIHHRKAYVATCCCPGTERIVRGGAPTKLIPRGCLSVGTIAFAVTARYLWGLPLHRITTILRQHGAEVPDGTLVGVFKAVQPLLVPLYAAICERNRHSECLHADETTWRQLWLAKGKRGYIWCFAGPDTTVYLFDAGRDHTVVLKYLGLDGTTWGGQVVDLMCDFLPSYDKAAKVANASERRLELSRCWSHYRRLWLDIPARHPDDPRVAAEVAEWLGMIADLFHLHHQRDLAADGSQEQDEAMAAFRGCLQEMEELRAKQLRRRKLAPELRHVLEFGGKHWPELTRPAADPHHPIDNNLDERRVRLPVVIRKNAYGSGARWAVDQACQVWTIGTTALHNGHHPLASLRSYFQACAELGGEVPPDWPRFLPWAEAACPTAATEGGGVAPSALADADGLPRAEVPPLPTDPVPPPRPRGDDQGPDQAGDAPIPTPLAAVPQHPEPLPCADAGAACTPEVPPAVLADIGDEAPLSARPCSAPTAHARPYRRSAPVVSGGARRSRALRRTPPAPPQGPVTEATRRLGAVGRPLALSQPP